MKKNMVMPVILVVVISIMAPVQAAARVVLVSTPIPGGDGGTICACVNVKKVPITVNFIRKAPGSTETTWSIEILPGGIVERPKSTSLATYCQIERSDGTAITKKQLLCTLSAIDVNGNPTLSVPVNITRKVPNW